MTLSIKIFGPQARLIGKRELRVEVEGERTTCAELRALLARRETRLEPSLSASRFAVNQHFASDHDAVGAEDEIALIGLISGG